LKNCETKEDIKNFVTKQTRKNIKAINDPDMREEIKRMNNSVINSVFEFFDEFNNKGKEEIKIELELKNMKNDELDILEKKVFDASELINAIS
jgi:hypothetical protein